MSIEPKMLLIVSDWLFQTHKKNPAREAFVRSSITRSYYAAYLSAKEKWYEGVLHTPSS